MSSKFILKKPNKIKFSQKDNVISQNDKSKRQPNRYGKIVKKTRPIYIYKVL